MSISLFPSHIQENYEIEEYRNAISILKNVYPNEWADIVGLLTNFVLRKSEIVASGGKKSTVADQLDSYLYSRGWGETEFKTAIHLQEVEYVVSTLDNGKNSLNSVVKGTTVTEVPTHKIDCFKNKVAVEVEWNNKDTFFDRDLNNFRLLFDLGAVSVGVIITRSSELQELFNQLGKGKSYGASTTHMRKLRSKLLGQGSGGCPVIAIGIKPSLYCDLT
ncbi:BglII/BstYI family type II restriction endonuclease [Acinetobacter baumannii]|uniref:BglII/BstYI family type II restriction endonuclease n=1 Tax=Acinetobacter baumannii TaxID=470 RepID=UPI0003DFA383|nr:BglII/BstYI family type II restriction endonuclease [Acinetobacter baumannii]EIM5574933.1 restriction endonuclease [Acinetobacter baumannii]EIO1626565.1 restriction endonuclease [Acinetobacter baumannii]EKX8585410.1 restriction endonuclease [Acinetobacter baumannii]ETQ98101.1 restriction endonuclease BglII [Acinetobacter baumannii UH6507]NLP53665.1 restriction endonuclease [Acinetobacter baumannii]